VRRLSPRTFWWLAVVLFCAGGGASHPRPRQFASA
jgi:hypothetical protein